MLKIAEYLSFVVCLHYVFSLNLPGPLVYVVTPSPRPPQPQRIDEGRSAPFYYHNWMRRMDSPQNATTTTSTTPKVETPDLIFAEFESHNGDTYRKSLRNLLEKEKIQPKTSTTPKPIYVPDDMPEQAPEVIYAPMQRKDKDEQLQSSTPDMTDYFALYHNLYGSHDAAPVYVPSSSPATTPFSTTSTTTTITAAAPELNSVQDIWHVIDSEKHNQYSGQWEEAPIESNKENTLSGTVKSQDETQNDDNAKNENVMDENFALPGFGTNPGNGAENESRAIRTEPNIRFPYINLKPFQMKNSFANSKKGNNNMFTNLDNFREVSNPVRGEAQDVMPMRQPIDRYNSAQPYFPPKKYGVNQKDSSSNSLPVKTVANLVPPPPPPPPPSSGNDFPAPDSYDSFPPYASANTDSAPAPPPAPAPAPPPRPAVTKLSLPKYQPPADTSYDSPPDEGNDGDDGPPTDLGYRYKPPSGPVQSFLPTLPPLSKPFKGYTYDKPPVTMDAPPAMDTPDFHGYHYKKPELPPNAPAPSDDTPPSPTYDHHGPNSYGDSDYPELIFNKHHGNDDSKGGDDMKGNNMGMMPPPPPLDMKPDMDNAGPPSDDHGFPHDFPGDFKYHHDFDHDFYHHHHHHTTTTTTTTEMPRVNRYSYYYLGKKLYYLPLYFSVYFIVYVGALIIKAVLRHKIVYPNSWRPNDQTQNFFSKRSIDSWDLSNENLHEITGKVTAAIGKAAEKYMNNETKEE